MPATTLVSVKSLMKVFKENSSSKDVDERGVGGRGKKFTVHGAVIKMKLTKVCSDGRYRIDLL